MKTIPFLFLALLSLNSCVNGDYSDEGSYKEAMYDATEELPEDRKLIRTGSLNFETGDCTAMRRHIDEIVKGYKGYVSDENYTHSEESNAITLTLRVPSESFYKVINEIARHAEKVNDKRISVTDVTENYIDIRSRIDTKKRLEERYLALLEKANTVEDMLEIETQAGMLRSDIEALESQMNYLNASINYSTIDVYFYDNSPDDLHSEKAVVIIGFVLITGSIVFFSIRSRKRKISR